MDLVHKVGWISDTSKGGARVYVVLPAVELLVALHGQEPSFVFCFEAEAVRLEVCAFDGSHVVEDNNALLS